VFLEVRILKKLAKNDLETKTERLRNLHAVLPVYYNSTNYRIVNAWIFWRGAFDTGRRWDEAVNGGAFQIGTQSMCRSDLPQSRGYNHRAQ
jgi:hypothetical protein